MNHKRIKIAGADDELVEVDIPIEMLVGSGPDGKVVYALDGQKLAELGINCHDLVDKLLPGQGTVSSEHNDDAPVAELGKPAVKDTQTAPLGEIVRPHHSVLMEPEPPKASPAAKPKKPVVNVSPAQNFQSA